MAPTHFQLPIGGPVLSLHGHAPLPVPRRPPAKGRACSEGDLGAIANEGVGLSGELASAQHAVVLLPAPHYAACGRHLSAHIQIVTCQAPPCHVVHTGGRN